MAHKVCSQTRQSRFSGSFYPADATDLKRVVRRCLPKPTCFTTQKPRVLIVPHAGYFFSGSVAGAGFAQVRDCSKIILLGVSHRQKFNEVVAFGGQSWKTPLGQVAINQKLVNHLVDSHSVFCINNTLHEDEHALEVQIPFLQEVLGEFQIVPLLLGNNDAINETSRALADLFDDRTLLIVSSDLSHYPCQADADHVDQRTIDAILSGQPEPFHKAIHSQLRQGIPGLVTCACGTVAILVGLHLAQLLQFRESRLLAYQNSGPISGDIHRVVGYTSIAFC